MTSETPFTDIYVDDDIVADVEDVLRSKRYVKGERLEDFEAAFAEKCGVSHAVGVSSGTSALLLALQSLDIEPGDEVFVPGHTFFATVSPVLAIGATPVFVDIDPETYTMDPTSLASAVREATNPAAVMPVHIYGQLADLDAITDIAAEHDLAVVEDACQAHFASRDGIVAGTAGDAAAFSFYPSKNMTVGGDGGMLVTNQDSVAERSAALRNHGRTSDGVHRFLGLNYRLDEIKAAVGHQQLNHIHEWNERRRDAAHEYSERLESLDEVTVPAEATESEHVYHLYVIQVPDRDDLQAHLENHGIQTGIHYETPAHKHPAVEERVGKTTLPVTETLCDRILSLPIHPRIEQAEIENVCDTIEGYYE